MVMITSFLRMQASRSDLAFQPLIDLLKDPVAELDLYPDAFASFLSFVRPRDSFLIFPSDKLTSWVVPETNSTHPLDFFELESCNDVELWNEDSNCWRYNKILAFAQIDFDFCLVQVNLQTADLSMRVYSRSFKDSRFWNQEFCNWVDPSTSECFNSLCKAMCNWLVILSKGRFEPTGSSTLNCAPADDPFLELIKHILISNGLFSDLNYSFITERSSLCKRLEAEAQQSAEFFAVTADEELFFAPPDLPIVPEYGISVYRPLPFEEWRGKFIPMAQETVFSIPPTALNLIRNYLKKEPKPSLKNMAHLVLFLAETFLTGTEIILLALELGFPLRISKGASVDEIYKTEQSIQQVFTLDGKTKYRDADKNQRRGAVDASRQMFCKRMENTVSKTILIRGLTDFGKKTALVLLGIEEVC